MVASIPIPILGAALGAVGVAVVPWVVSEEDTAGAASG